MPEDFLAILTILAILGHLVDEEEGKALDALLKQLLLFSKWEMIVSRI